MLIPSPDAFTALARSSPWRWSTLRFTVCWTGRYPTWEEPVRGWIRRPDRLRVETAEGRLVQVVREPRPPAPAAPQPRSRPDGLVSDPRRSWEDSLDDPMFQNYRWVAMLDPVELADGRDPDSGEPDGPALVLADLDEVEHAGRPAWEAVVRPTSVYEPRCGCCPLLRSRDVDLLEYGPGARQLLTSYPEAFRVRLDVGTGICVLTEEIGGLTPGAGHDLRIETVDEPMTDDLFAGPRGRLFRRGQ